MNANKEEWETVAVVTVPEEKQEQTMSALLTQLMVLQFVLLHEGDGSVIAPAFKKHLLDIIGGKAFNHSKKSEVTQ